MEQPLAVYSTGLFDVSGRNPGTELVVHLNLNKRDPVVLFAFQERLNGAFELTTGGGAKVNGGHFLVPVDEEGDGEVVDFSV